MEGECPAVDDRRQAACLERRVHLLLRRVRASRQRIGQAGRAVGVGSGRAEQAERGEPLLVGAVRLGWGEGLHPGPQLLEEGQLGGDGGRCREAIRGRCGAVRLQGQSALQRPDGIQVSRAVTGPAAHDRAHIRRELNHPGPGRRIRRPSLRDQQERPGRSPGRPAAHIGEVIGPRVDELQHVIAPSRVRHAQQHRAAAHIDLRDGVDGVVVDRHEPVLRPGQLRRVAEAVEGSWRKRPHALASEAADHLQVEDQRKAVDVGISGQRHKIITHPGPPQHRPGALLIRDQKSPARPCPSSGAPALPASVARPPHVSPTKGEMLRTLRYQQSHGMLCSLVAVGAHCLSHTRAAAVSVPDQVAGLSCPGSPPAARTPPGDTRRAGHARTHASRGSDAVRCRESADPGSLCGHGHRTTRAGVGPHQPATASGPGRPPIALVGCPVKLPRASAVSRPVQRLISALSQVYRCCAARSRNRSL